MELDTALAFVRSQHHGVLVTYKRDGRAQLSNIAYHVGEDSVIAISVTNGRAKTANVRRDGQVALHVTREDFYAYAVIDGDASVTPVAADPHDATADSLVEYYRAVAGEHDDWEDYRRAMVTDGRCLVRITPTHAYGMLPA